jgi:glycerol-3-phosphate O-acyltransferase
VNEIILKQVFYKNIELLRTQLIKLNRAGKIRLSHIVKYGSVEDLVKHGVNNIGIFHVQKALFIDKEGDISSEDLNLLFYYHNRLIGYNLGEHIEVKNVK